MDTCLNAWNVGIFLSKLNFYRLILDAILISKFDKLIRHEILTKLKEYVLKWILKVNALVDSRVCSLQWTIKQVAVLFKVWCSLIFLYNSVLRKPVLETLHNITAHIACSGVVLTIKVVYYYPLINNGKQLKGKQTRPLIMGFWSNRIIGYS